MSQDRFIRFKKDEKPTHEEVQFVCEDYIKGLGTVVWSKTGKRYDILIHGTVSNALDRITPAKHRAQVLPDEPTQERWIEVVVTGDTIDVLTRLQDEVTNAIADRLAEIFARRWAGELDAG